MHCENLWFSNLPRSLIQINPNHCKILWFRNLSRWMRPLIGLPTFWGCNGDFAIIACILIVHRGTLNDNFNPRGGCVSFILCATSPFRIVVVILSSPHVTYFFSFAPRRKTKLCAPVSSYGFSYSYIEYMGYLERNGFFKRLYSISASLWFLFL